MKLSVLFAFLALFQVVFGQSLTTCQEGGIYIEDDGASSGRYPTTPFSVSVDTYLDHIDFYTYLPYGANVKFFLALQPSTNNYNTNNDVVIMYTATQQYAASNSHTWITSPTFGYNLQAGVIYAVGAVYDSYADEYFCCFNGETGGPFTTYDANGNWYSNGNGGLHNAGNGLCDQAVKFYSTPAPPVAVCGNGIVESGEQCDSTACCTTTCTFASSSVVCRPSAGECDVAESCTGSSGSCPADSFASSSTLCPENFGVCNVNLNRMCPGNSAQCSGFEVPVLAGDTLHWTSFQVISFGGLVGESGNIGGRTAVRNSASFTQGFSVGSEIVLTFPNVNATNVPASIFTGYSFVVGGDLTWVAGELYPDTVQTEYALVGGSFAGADYLASRVYNNASVLSTLPEHFDNAQPYYTALQNNLNIETSNAAYTSQYSGLFVTCSENSDRYVLSVDSNDLSASLWWSVDSSCQYGSTWIINVVGNGDVMFQGGDFPGIGEQILYNIIGSNRLITVSSGVNGNILAPNNQFVQTGGVTSGLIIVADIQYISSAENPNCNAFQPFDIVVKTPQNGQRSAKKDSTPADEIEVASFSQIIVGDVCSVSGFAQNFTVTGRIEDNGKYYLQVTPTPSMTIPAGSTIVCEVSNPYANRTQTPITVISTQESSASTVSVFVAFFVAIIALMI